MSAIIFQGVTKRYGSTLALNGLSFTVPKGSVCALIGPNGAGKTTAMGVIAGLLKPTAGEVDLLGAGPYLSGIHAGRIGLMPQDSVPSPHSPIREILKYYAELQGFAPPKAKEAAEQWLERVQLNEKGGSRFGQLSHGMRRRFSVAQALLGGPELVLLDEPTSGLDPELSVQVRQLISSQRGKATLLVSSHVLAELEDLCDYVIFMDAGRALRQGTMAEITGRGSSVRFMLSQAPNVAALEVALPGYQFQWQSPCLSVHAPSSNAVEDTNAACLRLLLEQGVGIQQVLAGSSLEDAYLQTKRR